jgi:putative pyruvate formate lyase activating enzyme
MRAKRMLELYNNCVLCPRSCQVNRLEGQRGYCGETAGIRVAWAGLHRGEEPSLIGGNGSGTVFFTGCTLKCDSCQNCQLSAQGLGTEVSIGRLQEMMLRVQEQGAANINLVTATHFAPSVVESVSGARTRGLSIPVVWNSSGYEHVSTLELLEQSVDVYLPDCKTLDSDLSRALMGAADYPVVVQPALRKMVRDKSLTVEKGQLRQGVLVRHLVLPGLLWQTRQVLEWFALHLKNRALLSLMFQYTPVGPQSGGQKRWSGQGLQRTVNRDEYEQVLSWLEDLGVEEGYVQNPATGDSWLPDFTRLNPFPPGQAQPVWHYRSGFIE